jgi:hypothetical protein
MIINEDKMYVYLWSEEDHECKFGQRWVNAGQDPVVECGNRIRASLGVRKDKFPMIEKRGYQVWDVTDYAKKFDMFDKKKKVDDNIRKIIGFRKGTSGEVHSIPQSMMSLKVSEFLRNFNEQKLSVATLSTAQYETAMETVKAFDSGHKIILAELCARFGKTIWSAAVATEIGAELVIVASYIQTVFSSFASDIARFEQFKEYVHVDAAKEDYKLRIEEAYAKGSKVFVYLSLCNGSLREDRIDHLFSISKSRLLIIDEADNGAHQPKQALPLINALGMNDRVIIMTGTNADRAATHWKVDKMISVNYFELLTHKEEVLQLT